MKKLLILLSLSLLLIACASDASINAKIEPEWVSKPSAVYPDKDYITGVGYSDTRMKAENAAHRALANYIVQDISAHSTASSSTQISGSALNQSQNIEEELSSSSRISTIVGLGIKEVWYDSQGTYYALALLDRAEASSFYSDKIRANSMAIEELRAIAQKNSGTFDSNRAYNQAIVMAKESEEYLTLMVSIDNTRRKLLEAHSPSPASLLLEARADAKDINLAINVKGAQSAKVQGFIISAFAAKGIEVQNDLNASSKYVLDCQFDIVDMPSQGGNKFVSYTLTATLNDRIEGKDIGAILFSGRDGHATRVQAIERALSYVEEYIHSEEFNF